jgi:hypothetical protein
MITSKDIDKTWANRCLFGAWLPALLAFPVTLALIFLTAYLMGGSDAFSGFGGMGYIFISVFLSFPLGLVSLFVNFKRLKRTEPCSKTHDFALGISKVFLSSVVSLGVLAGGIALWCFATNYNL